MQTVGKHKKQVKCRSIYDMFNQILYIRLVNVECETERGAEWEREREVFYIGTYIHTQ